MSVLKWGRVFALFTRLTQWQLAKSDATIVLVTEICLEMTNQGYSSAAQRPLAFAEGSAIILLTALIKP